MKTDQINTSYEILRFLQEEAMSLFPAFPAAFGQLVPKTAPEIKPEAIIENSLHKTIFKWPLTKVFSTDGVCLYYHPLLLRTLFLEKLPLLRRSYLHTHLHCICFHIVQSAPVPGHLWDMACDLSAELLAALLCENPESQSVKTAFHRLLSEHGQNPVRADEASWTPALTRFHSCGWLPPGAILPLLENNPKLQELSLSCVLDDHSCWSRDLLSDSFDSKVCGSDACCSDRGHGNGQIAHQTLTPDHLDHLEKLQMLWNMQLPNLQQELKARQKGGKAGTLSEEADLQQRDSQDYRKFLRQFAVPGEEAILDIDSFDYIPYYYGMACYAQEITNFQSHAQETADFIPFIEPLEYTEVNRLDELAIAIDTSGSCSGRIVRRFLEETWSILRQRENFFAKMRLHLIQCDCMIQEHRIFTSVEEWETALSDLKILGHGNTNFQPVFEYLEKLTAKKEIRRLRGLLYFTDGDGIFPDKAPAWDTAFVFLNQQTEKHAIPRWAIRLNLHLPEDF